MKSARRFRWPQAAPNRPLLAYWAFNCFTTCGDANFTPESVSQNPASMTSTFVFSGGSTTGAGEFVAIDNLQVVGK